MRIETEVDFHAMVWSAVLSRRRVVRAHSHGNDGTSWRRRLTSSSSAAGPAAIAAIRAAQLGLKTACIDEWKTADGKPAWRHVHQHRLHSLEGPAAVFREFRAGGASFRRSRP